MMAVVTAMARMRIVGHRILGVVPQTGVEED